MKQILSQILKFVPLLSSADINAGVDSDSVDMQGVQSATFQLVFGPSYGGANPAIIKLYSGATHGAKTTAMTFNYRYGGGAIKAASADVLSDIASSAALSIARATMVSRLLLLEVNADQITDGHRYLTVEVGAESDSGELCIIALLDPMYLDAGGDSVID
jgi:hypothetical protein